MNLDQARVVVVVFTMQGCPACKEFLPRFQRIAPLYSPCVPIVYADANDPRYAALADRLKVSAVPASFVLRRPRGIVRLDGAVEDNAIRWLLDVAAREAVCPVPGAGPMGPS